MRNAEVIRQWQILREVESHRTGVTIHELAGRVKVSTRTIRRDLQALQEAGFAVYDEGAENETKRWKLEVQPFRSVQEGLSVTDVAALYLSRSVVLSIGGWPLAAELTAAFEKIERALNPRLREFLSTLPQVLSTKAGPRARPESDRLLDATRRLFDAARDRHVVDMRYFSAQSNRSQAVHRAALPAGPRARRGLSGRLGASLRSVPHVRGRSRRAPQRHRRHVQEDAGVAGGSVWRIARRLLGRAGEDRAGIRIPPCALRARARLARLAGDRGTARRPPPHAPARLERLGAEKRGCWGLAPPFASSARPCSARRFATSALAPPSGYSDAGSNP